MQLRKIIMRRGQFPADDAAMMLPYRALRNLSKKWRNVSSEWRTALSHLVLLFDGRFIPATV